MRWKYVILLIVLSIGGLFLLQNLYQERREKEMKLLIDKLEKQRIELEKAFVVFFPKELSDSCPIKASTTKIIYTYHTNCGRARYSEYQIFRDSLVWDYYEARNHCHLKDVCRYERDDYDELIKTLSEWKFSGNCNLKEVSAGGAGYGYYFEDNTQCYLHYNDSYQLAGEHNKVDQLIKQFIENHKTQCEILFEKYSNEPHEQALFGEFQSLPPKLLKYVVR